MEQKNKGNWVIEDMRQCQDTLRLVSRGTERVMILGKAPLPNDEFVFGGWGFVKILPYENARAGWMGG